MTAFDFPLGRLSPQGTHIGTPKRRKLSARRAEEIEKD